MDLNMSFSAIQSSQPTNQPNWVSLSSYKAETTLLDKVHRVANHLIFGAGLFGIYAFAKGGSGGFVYASYLSLALALRKVLCTSLGYLVYPAASFLPFRDPSLTNDEIEETRGLELDGFIVKKISLYKSGTRYDARLIAHPDLIQKGHWTIHALGNGMEMESCIQWLAKENLDNKFNTLLINGPSVSQSGGWPTPYQMGAGFEAGITFLEREVRATHLMMCGFSLGGGMMGQAILAHDFSEGMKNNIRYLPIIDRSFSRLSTVAEALVFQTAAKVVGQFAGKLISRIVRPIFYAIGMELDGVAAARKLSQLGIRQIIIQHNSQDGSGSDAMIPDNSSLAYELGKDLIVEHKTFLESEEISHNGPLPKEIDCRLTSEIKAFLDA
jgi:hypothetical protein